MQTLPQPIQRGAADLTDHRHICALVDGPDEAYELLMPFIVDGFEQGDRAFHIVDPESRDSHMQRLTTGGVDVPGAVASGQLEVLTWTDSYLRSGRFDRSAQLARVKQSLAEGHQLGFPRTRLIGNMEWVLGTESASDLLAYEARLNDLVRKTPDILVCVYDLNRQSARMIADVLGVHPGALVGGVLRSSEAQPSESARDRLLTAASQLFTDGGIRATGVDALIATAGVAKATFYRHFPSKDDLVVAWLRDRRTRWLDRIRSEIEASEADAAQRISMFFDAVIDWLETESYRGCPYLNVAVEITTLTHPARPIVTEYLQEVEDYLDGLLAAAGYRESRALAAGLQTLVAGAISLAVARRTIAPALIARDAARKLLSEAERD